MSDGEYEDGSFAVAEGDILGTSTQISQPPVTVNSLPTEDELKIAHSIVRIIMSREVRGTVIRRDNFSEVYVHHPEIKRTKFELMFQFVQGILKDVYGLQLVNIPEKIPTTKNRKKKSSNTSGGSRSSGNANANGNSNTNTTSSNNNNNNNNNENGSKTGNGVPSKSYCLVSVLPASARNVLGEIWKQEASKKVPNGRNEDDEQYLLPKYKKTDSANSNIELIKSGVLALVLGILVLSNNRVSEQDLLKQLKKFGLSESINAKNSSLNLSTVELLSEFVKKEYIEKEGDNNSEIIDYTLGRRSFAEFKPQSMYDLVSNIYGAKFDLDLQAKTMNTIERSFGENIEIQREVNNAMLDSVQEDGEEEDDEQEQEQ